MSKITQKDLDGMGAMSCFTWAPEDLEAFLENVEMWSGENYFLAVGPVVFTFTDYRKRGKFLMDFLHVFPTAHVFMLPLQAGHPASQLFVIDPRGATHA